MDSAVDAVVVGAATPREAQDNVTCLSADLPAELLAELEEAGLLPAPARGFG